MLLISAIILLPSRRCKWTILINLLIKIISLRLIQILIDLNIALIQIVLVNLPETHLSVILIRVLVLLLDSLVGFWRGHAVDFNYLHQNAP